MFSCFTFKKFTKSVSVTLSAIQKCFCLEAFGMVRYFQNVFEDYNNSGLVNIDTGNITGQIDQHINIIMKRLPALPKYVDGGLYVGITGVAYMFYHLSKNTQLSQNKIKYLEQGIEYINKALETTSGDRTSFLLGDAGALVVATVLYKEYGDKSYESMLNKYRSLYAIYLKPNFLKCGADEFFVGRSGYLAGALWLSRELKTPVFTNEEFYKICDTIVESGRSYSQAHRSSCPLMYHYYGTEYLGAAHGVSFILQMLLSVPGYIQQTQYADDIKKSVYFMLSLQNREGNWPCSMDEINEDEHKLVHWCHGAPGTVYLMAKAYLVYKDEQFYQACVKAADLIWMKGLLRKGPGICHGVSGNGYVFLLLHRLTGDQKYLHRAQVFAEFMNSDKFLNDARVPDNPQSLYEGTAGAVCYLGDLLVPDIAEFPFQDVFS